MKIEVKPLTAREQMRLAEDVGRPSMARDWWARVTLAACVRSIDGVAIQFPQHYKHIRATTLKLGDKGLAKVTAALAENKVPDVKPPALVVRKLDSLEMLDLGEMAGEKLNVRPWHTLAFLACSVRSIDGAETKFPKTTKELYKLVEDIGDAGMDAADEIMRAQNAEAIAEDEGDEAVIKN